MRSSWGVCRGVGGGVSRQQVGCRLSGDKQESLQWGKVRGD